LGRKEDKLKARELKLELAVQIRLNYWNSINEAA